MSSPNQLSRIREALRSRNPGLLNRAERLIAQADQLSPHTLSTFPSGTEHGPPHTATVEQIASMLITDALLMALSDHELFFLLLGFHYHDLGMAGTEADNATASGRRQVRDEHAVSIAHRIVESWREIGFEDENEAVVLGEICRGHRPARSDGRASWDAINEVQILRPGCSVRLRLLSAVVYASDELHIGADRAPDRVRYWKKIGSDDARPHWERHQEIVGPDVIKDCLAFDVRPRTIALEEDLRRHVLRKALLAVDDLKRFAEAAGLVAATRPVVIRWQRSLIWQLLTVRSLADEPPLSKQEIVERILVAYQTSAQGNTDLADLCREENAAVEDIKVQIGRTVEELVRLGQLSPDGSSPPRFTLASTGRECAMGARFGQSSRRCRSTMQRTVCSRPRVQLLRGHYGKRYVTDVVTPAVKYGYSVDLSLEKADSPVRLLIERSPTACRFVSDIAPMPSAVKRELLAAGILVGFFMDVLRDPDLLLEADTRKAARTLARDVADQLPRFLSFMEELALIGGWTMEQVMGVLVHPFESLPADLPDADSDVKVTVTQTLPQTYPTPSTGFAYLTLAGLRAGIMVSLLDRPESRLEITVPEQLAPKKTGGSDPTMISMGPPQSLPAARFDLRCKMEIDAANGVVRLIGYDLGDPEAASLPLVAEISPPMRFPQETTGKANISARPACMTVGDLAKHRQMTELIRREGTRLEVIVAKTDRPLAEMRFPPTGPLLSNEIAQPDLLAALLAIDPQIPLPLLIRKEDAAAITSADPAERPAVYRRTIDDIGQAKPEITTLYLVRAAASGMAFQEEFLGFLPDVPFQPKVGDPEKQQFLDEQWQKREQIMGITCYMVKTAEEIAQAVIRWAEDRSPPFPGIHIWKDASVPHHCKAISQTDFLPAIDRQWYRELPMRVVVRPLTREEELEVEVAYWQSVGDVRRAELAEERLQAVREARDSAEAKRGSAAIGGQTDALPSQDEK